MERTRSGPRLSRRALLRAGLGSVASAVTVAAWRSPLVRAQAATGAMVGLVTPRVPGDLGAVDDLAAGLERAAAELGVATSLAVAPDPVDQAAAIRRLAADGASIIVVAFPEAAEALHAVAPTLPAVRFIHLAADPGRPDLPNLRSVTYDTWPAAWLAGVLGATVSLTRQVGFVGGADAPAQRANLRSVIGGVEHVDRLVPVVGASVGDWQATERARELAVGLAAAGADLIVADAGAGDLGVLEAAAETSTFAIVGSEALAATAPATVVGTLGVLYGQSLFEQVRGALEPGWEGGAVHSGLADGIVDLQIADAFLTQGPAEMADRVRDSRPLVDSLREQLIAGTIAPRYDPRPMLP